MRKYKDSSAVDKDNCISEIATSQRHIANELAEANRLKRLELRQIDHKLWNEATSQKLTKKDLEDQA